MIITTKSNKSIQVFDDLISHTAREETYIHVQSSNYKIGWGDGVSEEMIKYRYLHSMYSHEEVTELSLWKEIQNSPIIEQIKHLELKKAISNLSTPSDVNFIHSHPEQKVLLYYVNFEWNNGWHGETHFYDESFKNVEFTSPYTPGRLILFDGSIPHCIRPQSSIASNYRFTLALTFD